jgi:murein L,D-transpeptidase YafK
MKYLLHILTLLPLSVLFVACVEEPEVSKTEHYNLKECKEELLDATDYAQDAGIDKIVVVKKDRKMYLYKEGKIEDEIPVSLGKNPVGHKQQQGDNRTPEGEFFIHRKLCSPQYYRSLCISYPRPEDISSAEARGVNPGGAITIHAQPKWNADGKSNDYTLSRNWTQGCVAVTNDAMSKLWYAVREGVPVTIK